MIFSNNIPSFTTLDPNSWFSLVEQIFLQNKITNDHQKFILVLNKLDNNTLAVVTPLLKNHPNANQYQTIKNKLLSHFS